MKKTALPPLLLAALAAAMVLAVRPQQPDAEKTGGKSEQFRHALSISTKKDKFARFSFESRKLVDPQTGKIPPNMRAKELAFAKTLQPAYKTAGTDSLEWVQRGPYNIGGRTRALAVDITNENVLLAGGVSGGIWRSEDGGQSWAKISTNDEHQGVTCIAQDTRPGHTGTWYYGTGEGYGNSAGDGGSYYLGNGLYKSIDGGFNWVSMPVTATNSPQTFDSSFDIIWNIALDPSNQTQAEVYLAIYGSVYRSTNGGLNWVEELGGTVDSYATDVLVTGNGTVYATLSGDGSAGGIWRSADGMNWTRIEPAGFPDDFGRIVMCANPSNQNELYFVAAEVTPGMGKETFNFRHEPEWNALWKYTYLSGNGSGAGGNWADLSENLPLGPYRFDDFNVQGGYDMVIRVKPNDPNTVFLGGTNLYRSTDGFSSPDNTTFIGGYGEDTDLPLFVLYPNQHPDQHALAFLPSNPDVMISGNDGGIYKTYDNTAPVVEWQNLNNGYVTTQFYTVAIDKNGTDNRIIGGLQDNGSRFVDSADPTDTWTMPFNYDGAFCAIPSNQDYFVMSVQLGRIVKVKVDGNGLLEEYVRIDPAAARPDDYLFINPLMLDPNDENRLYTTNGRRIFGNDNISLIPFTNAFDSLPDFWYQMQDTIPSFNGVITAFTVCKEPAYRMYVGTDEGDIYRIDNASDPASPLNKINSPQFPGNGYTTCVAADPRNGDHVFAVFSNYSVYSLFYSTDGGGSWQKVAGNLEQNTSGSGNGPSLRWLNILPLENGDTARFLGTSVGMFYNRQLNGQATQWLPLAEDEIGTTVVEMVESRETDNLIVVATHGNGVFTANTPPDPPIGIQPGPQPDFGKVKAYPNPATDRLTVSFELERAGELALTLYDALGRRVKTIHKAPLNAGVHSFGVDVSNYPPGVYYYGLETENFAKRWGVVLGK